MDTPKQNPLNLIHIIITKAVGGENNDFLNEHDSLKRFNIDAQIWNSDGSDGSVNPGCRLLQTPRDEITVCEAESYEVMLSTECVVYALHLIYISLVSLSNQSLSLQKTSNDGQRTQLDLLW